MNLEIKKRNILAIFKILEEKYEGVIELKYSEPIELLIAVILSAQCTDVTVNKVTEKLFKKYKKIEDYAYCDLDELKKDIRSTGFFNNKAKNIKETCRIILEQYNGKIPDTMEELIKLNGVGRKTANIILSNIYKKSEGIAVDTHMLRINYRIGLTSSKDNPITVEKELMKILPKKLWNKFTYLIINHGRSVCIARNPSCEKCVIKKLCDKN